jgi:hypothetical protein
VAQARVAGRRGEQGGRAAGRGAGHGRAGGAAAARRGRVLARASRLLRAGIPCRVKAGDGPRWRAAGGSAAGRRPVGEAPLAWLAGRHRRPGGRRPLASDKTGRRERRAGESRKRERERAGFQFEFTLNFV